MYNLIFIICTASGCDGHLMDILPLEECVAALRQVEFSEELRGASCEAEPLISDWQ